MYAASFETLLVTVALLLLAAKVVGELFERLGQPAVIGELFVGVVLGNMHLVGVDCFEIARSDVRLEMLSNLGVIVLMFEVGLASNVQQMLRVGASSFVVATLGVVAPMALGGLALHALRPSVAMPGTLFVAATLAATSVGITARVYRDLKALDSIESRIVLGAAVIDDVLGLVVLAIVQGMVTAAAAGNGGGVGLLSLTWIVLKAVGFLAGAIMLGGRIAPRLFRAASYLRVHGMLVITAFGACFLLSWASAVAGLAPIVGAFAAGLILDEVHTREFTARGERSLADEVRPVATLLVPLFFVRMGFAFDLRAFGNADVVTLAALLCVAAIAGKQVCGLGVIERGLDRVSVGVGMIPRGEVGLIVADAGRHLTLGGKPVVDDATFSAVVVVVLVSTVVSPPLLKWSLGRKKAVVPCLSP